MNKLGFLFQIKLWTNDYPVMEMLALGPIERQEAQYLAIKETLKTGQVIFMHRNSGQLEVWDVAQLNHQLYSAIT